MGNKETDSLRDSLMALGMRDPRIVKIGDLEVALHPPSVKQRGRILLEAGVDDSKRDLGKLQAYALLYCARHPTSGQPLFDETHLDALQDAASGSALDDLGLEAINMINVDTNGPEVKND